MENNDLDVLESDKSEMSTPPPPPQSITLELGDIIEIIAPTNPEINQIEAIITYIDESKIKLLNTSTAKFYQLNINEENRFTDESITEIYLLNRSDDKGYARQNGLLPRVWVDIHFAGEIPTVITGEITNLEEDMIELTTYPTLQTIYVNFGYRGIPENLPIEKIMIREKPASLKSVVSLAVIKDKMEQDNGDVENIGEYIEMANHETNEATMEFNEIGESVIHIPETATPDENVNETLHDLYVDADTIIFGETLEAIAQLVEVPEGQQRYSIEIQINDLMNELLSTIPNHKRTTVVLNNIHLITERFKELRTEFSFFDENQNIKGMKTIDPHYKPMIERAKKMDTKLRWLIPVATHRRKLYDVEDADVSDVISDKTELFLKNIYGLQRKYYEENSKEPLYYYENIEQNIHNLLSSFENPAYSDTFLFKTQVNHNFDTVIDNLEDFYSSSAKLQKKDVELSKTRYLIQRYNLGEKTLDKKQLGSGKTIYLSKALTPNDEITVKSVIMMPEPVVRFSAIDLPATNIIDRVSYHHHFLFISRILSKNAEIIPNIIGDLSKEFDYDKMEKDTQKRFLQGINDFILDKDVNRETADVADKYEQFMQVIIPKTKVLVNLIRKYIKNKVSFIGVIQQLEPFLIYPADITYKQYLAIRYTINTKIEEIKAQYKNKSSEFALLRSAKYATVKKPNAIMHLLSEKREYLEELVMAYRFAANPDNNALSSSEILLKMNNGDSIQIYTYFIRLLLISLVSPSSLLDVLAKPSINDMGEPEKIKPADCSRRYLAKKYGSVGELQKDNHVDDLFFDKEFDDTPYEILGKYKDDQKRMSPELFVDFLTQTLVDKHECPANIANELAKTLVAKKKSVTDGVYAILELRPKLPAEVDESKLSDAEKNAIRIESDVRKKVQYYRRLKNNWIHDDTINEEAFIDNNQLFCNISKDCLKNTKNNVCENTTDTAARMKEIAKRKMLGEFNSRYTVNVEELEKTLNKSMLESIKLMNKIKVLKEIQLYRANNLAVEIGNFANNTDALVLSPFLKLRDLIFEQDDFVKKQHDICKFVNEYCRDSLDAEEEDAHWKYCLETNTKLFPVSIHRLADAFVYGNNYQIRLDEICHEFGVLSDDGDSIVDKYSGFVLRKIDFSTEEGFDDAGFKITTRSIMEEDTSIQQLIAANKKPVFEDETSQLIYNVLNAICDHLDISTETVREFVMVNSADLIQTIIEREDKYTKRAEKMLNKQNKKIPPYEEYRDETVILIIAGCIVVSIQTAIPSIHAKKTFPGCVRSFKGYPLDGGAEDLGGIQYISCVLKKIASSIRPWKALKSYKPDQIVRRLKQMIEINIIARNGVNELYVKKRNHELLNPEVADAVSAGSEKHSVSKWRGFLPPLVPYDVAKHLKNVSQEYVSDLNEVIKRGHHDQFKMMYVLKDKIAKYGYGMIEIINDNIKTKTLILQTAAAIPFLENACCNDTDLTNPFSYFNAEEENIARFSHIVVKLAKEIKRIDRITDAGLLYNDAFTGMKYPDLPAGQLEDTIYDCIIKYCNLDKEKPIPAEFLGIINEKPVFYDRNWSIQEKVEFFKKNGKRYGIETLQQVMKIVFWKNRVLIEPETAYDQVDAFRDILLHEMEMQNSTVCVERLCAHIKGVVDLYMPNTLRDVSDAGLSEKLIYLKDYLILTNKNILQKILDFFNKHGNLTKPEKTRIAAFLSDVAEWGGDSQEQMHQFAKFMETAIFSLTNVYPTILLNGNNIFTNVPFHWNLSGNHEYDIERAIYKYFDEIRKYKADPTIERLLETVKTELDDVIQFVRNIPVYSELKKNVHDGEEIREHTFCSLFDAKATRLLFTYFYYSSIYEYIVSTENRDLVKYNLENVKSANRAKNAGLGDQVSSVLLEGGDETDEQDSELQEMDFAENDTIELKKNVCSLLLAFIKIEMDNKNLVSLSYSDIKKKVNFTKNEEKKRIMESFRNLDNESRRVENSLKDLRIGDWNVGQQKSLFQYNPKMYDKEREFMVLGEENPAALMANRDDNDAVDGDEDGDEGMDYDGAIDGVDVDDEEYDEDAGYEDGQY
jgi:hypothetical protein